MRVVNEKSEAQTISDLRAVNEELAGDRDDLEARLDELREALSRTLELMKAEKFVAAGISLYEAIALAEAKS